MKNTISVAMTTYNGEKYLDEQLESILHQTHAPYELVVGDDGSTDNTVALLSKFAERAPFPVRIINNKPHLGVFDNFLYVFNQCQGQCIAYCDQDDVWLPIKLEKCLAVLIENDAVLVSHRSEIVDSNLQSRGGYIPYGFPLGCYCKPHFPLRYWSVGHQMVFRRELVAAMNYSQQEKGEDLAFSGQDCYDLLLNFISGIYGSSVFISEPLTKFRRHSKSISACGKDVTRENNFSSKWQRKKEELTKVVRSLELFHRYLTMVTPRDSLGLDPATMLRYLNFLCDLQVGMRYRLQIYTGVNFANRAMGFCRAIRHRIYKHPLYGGVGLRQAAIDLLSLLRRVA